MAKVLISMPDELLAAIDAAVRRRRMSRSEFIQGAARDALSIPDRGRIEDAVARGRAAIARIGAFDSAAEIRADRDAHDATDPRR